MKNIKIFRTKGIKLHYKISNLNKIVKKKVDYSINSITGMMVWSLPQNYSNNKKYTYSKQGIYNLWVGTYKKGIKKIKNEFYTN